MNALAQKETRLLLPNFLIGLAAAFSMWLAPKHSAPSDFWSGLRMILPFFLCPSLLLMLALDSFGREMTARTFCQLLAQPVSRTTIWRTKTFLLAGAMLLIWVIWLAGFSLISSFSNTVLSQSDVRAIIAGSVLFVLAAYSGGLWTVLLFRQVAVAFWFTLLTPAALLVSVLWLLDEHPDSIDRTIVSIIVLYAGWGFLFARRLFLRAQDVQWTGGVIALPKWRVFSMLPARAGSQRRFGPRLAMLGREFQLHQSQLIIAGGLAVLHLGMIAARNCGNGFKTNGTVDVVLHQFWGLWMIMPLLVGCAAVAEERKLGTLEGQLCLPARRRTQFVSKLGVVLLLSVLLGAVMPVLMETVDGSRILPDSKFSDQDWTNAPLYLTPAFQAFFHGLTLISNWLPLLALMAGCAATGAIAFYFSTLSRSTLQALGPTMLGIFALVFVLSAGFLPELLVDYPLWRGFLAYLIGVPALILAGLVLAGWNYRRVQTGWPLWWRNLLALTMVLLIVIGTTTALYHRVWELAGPLEPAHGAARLTVSQGLKLQNQFGSLAVQLPDGQVWSGNVGFYIPNLTALLMSNWQLKELGGRSKFLDGTNWASLADCTFDTVGVQKDGSLWVAQKPLPREFFWVFFETNEPSLTTPAPLERLGAGRDWKSAASFGRSALLLKQDGTLWAWQIDHVHRTNKWAGLRALKLEQVGTNSNWMELSKSSGWICLRSTDGRMWSDCFHAQAEQPDDLKLADSVTLHRAPFLDQHDWRGMAWNYGGNKVVGGFLAGVREDGTFRVIASWARDFGFNPQTGKYSPIPFTQNFQLGRETNWLDAVAFGDSVVTLKADGSLWQWTFTDDPQTHPDSATTVRIGTHSDWVAVATQNLGFTSLAADGSLWFWRLEMSNYAALGSEFGLAPLIGVSRKPQMIANIFAEMK